MRAGMRGVAVGAVALVLGLSGCGGSDKAPTDADSTGVGASTTRSGEGASAGADSIEEFFGFGGSENDRRSFAEGIMRKAQDKIAACMRKEGFEYVAYVPDSGLGMIVGPQSGQEVEWKRKHGYGMAESLSSLGAEERAKDPNQAIKEKLSESDQRAYQKALMGTLPDPTDTVPSGGFMPGGCTGAAFLGDAASRVGALQIAQKYEDLTKRIEADKRVVEINRKWASCMREHGYSATSEEDLFDKVLVPEQSKVLTGSAAAADGSESVAEGGGAVVGVGGAAPPIDAKKLDAFRAFELKVANADADCRPQKDADKLRAIQHEYEKAFIADNSELLTTLKDSLT